MNSGGEENPKKGRYISPSFGLVTRYLKMKR